MKAYWIMIDGLDEGDCDVYCSNCRRFSPGEKRWKQCPRCGATMSNGDTELKENRHDK